MNPEKKDRVQAFIRALVPALTKARQYTVSHQETISSIEIACRRLKQAIGNERSLAIMAIDDKIVIQEQTLEETLYTSRLIGLLRTRGIEHITFGRGITSEELASFVGMLSTNPKRSQPINNLPHIQVGSVALGYRRKSQEPAENQSTEEETDQAIGFEDIQFMDLALLADIYAAAKENEKLPGDDVSKIVSGIISAIRQESSMLLSFSALRVLDEYTFTHSINVCILTLAQAMALGVEDELLHDIGVAALLHDVGKIFVPEEVLNKQGKLTDNEWELIRQHPQKGAEYLLDNPGIPPIAVTVAFEHHMQYDFAGYPKISGYWQQNMCSQMTTISDFFDALRTKRVYRDSVEFQIIAEKMNSMAGTALHPMLTKNFLILMNALLRESQAAN